MGKPPSSDPPSSRANHRQIAKICGLSSATVSRALAEHPHVSPETRRKVLEAAKTLGYQNDPRFAYLSRLRWGHRRAADTVVIGVLLDRYTSQNPAKFLLLKEAALARGYTLEMIQLEKAEQEGRNLNRELYHRGICGLLICIHDPTALPELDWERFTTVLVGEERKDLSLVRISTDWTQVFDLACRHLSDSGAKQLGFILADSMGPGLNLDLRVQALYRHAEMRLQCKKTPPIFFFQDRDPAAQKKFLPWVRQFGIDALISNNSLPVEWCKKAGRTFRHCLIPFQPTHPEIAGIDLCLNERLATALGVLHERLILDLRGLTEYPVKILCASKWQPGKTK